VDEEIRRILGVALTSEETQALANWYAAQAKLVAEFPADALKQVEPPLRSVPGPAR
jgi:hypothetical protein